MCRLMGGPNWCIGSPSRLTKSAKESPCFSMPMRLAATPTRLSGLAPPGRPRPPMRYSMSVTRTPFSGRAGDEWLELRPCRVADSLRHQRRRQHDRRLRLLYLSRFQLRVWVRRYPARVDWGKPDAQYQLLVVRSPSARALLEHELYGLHVAKFNRPRLDELDGLR